MVKVSFQFDSTDSLSSAFFNWLSSIPLEKSGLRFETAIDYTAPNSENESDATHRIGNIIVDLASDQFVQTGRISDDIGDRHRSAAMPKPPDNVYLDASESSASESYSSDALANQFSSQTDDDLSLNDFAFSDHSRQKAKEAISVSYAKETETASLDLDLTSSRFGQKPSSATIKTDSIFVDSNGAAFDSDVDDDIMADVLFAVDNDSDAQEVPSEEESEKEASLNAMNADGQDTDVEQDLGSLDYLVDSLDVFDV